MIFQNVATREFEKYDLYLGNHMSIQKNKGLLLKEGN